MQIGYIGPKTDASFPVQPSDLYTASLVVLIEDCFGIDIELGSHKENH